jgi:hypothetical protein
MHLKILVFIDCMCPPRKAGLSCGPCFRIWDLAFTGHSGILLFTATFIYAAA